MKSTIIDNRVVICDYCTVYELAQELGKTPAQVRSYIKNNKLKTTKINPHTNKPFNGFIVLPAQEFTLRKRGRVKGYASI